jgi:hypothetical protein
MTTEEQLQGIADFDLPFRVNADGSLTGEPGVYAPEVYNDDDHDIEIMGDGWTALTGYTGQYGYHGAVMHPSEYLGGRLAADILTTPGVYVCTVVEVLDDDDDPEPAGWVVLRLDEGGE